MTYSDAYTKGLLTYKRALKVYRQPKFTFLKDFFFSEAGEMTAKTQITSHFSVRGQEIVNDTRRGDAAKTLNQDFSYRNRAYTAPYYFLKDQVSAPDRDVILPQEDLSNPWSDVQKLMYKISQKENQINDNLDISEEKLCADILTTGMIVPTVQEGGDIEFLKVGDANFPVSDNIYSETAGNYWDAVDASIYDRLNELTLKEFDRRGVMPTTLIVTSKIAMLLMKDTFISNILNNRRMMAGGLTPKKITAEGYVEMGNLILPSGADLRIISYNGFTKSGGSLTRILPENKVILSRPGIGEMNYCGVETNVNGLAARKAAKRYTTIHSNNDIPAFQEVKIQTSPLPMPIELDGWATIQVIA